MKILITHGYLLSGTGSNLYVNNLVTEICKAGHEVYLVCQEYFPENMDFISEIYEFNTNNRGLRLIKSNKTPYKGKCKFFQPYIDGFLPVYVFDHYKSFRVKEFPDCSDAEIENYITLNRNAIQTIVQEFQIDVIQTNHTIPFPHIAANIATRHKIPLFVTVHGSALNFSVKKDVRFFRLVRTGFASATNIFVDSQYAFDELVEFLQKSRMKGLIEKIQIIPAGVDIEKFNILKTSRTDSIRQFTERLSLLVTNSKGRTNLHNDQILKTKLQDKKSNEALVKKIRSSYDYRFVDQDVIKKIRIIDWERDNIVLFIGKYLWTKGLHLIIFAIPFILKKYPNTKFIFVGFGPFREIAELILNCLSQNRLNSLLSLIQSQSALFKNSDGTPLPLLEESLKNHQEKFQTVLDSTYEKILDSTIFTGILDHANLRYLLPCADVLIAPSVFPEAFGMVAVEALSAGVFPIVTYQSAFKEIADLISKELQLKKISVQSIHLNDDAFLRIAENVIVVFQHLYSLRREDKIEDYKNSLREMAVKNFSWSGITDRYIRFYQDLFSCQPSAGQRKQ